MKYKLTIYVTGGGPTMSTKVTSKSEATMAIEDAVASYHSLWRRITWRRKLVIRITGDPEMVIPVSCIRAWTLKAIR